jgi:hypothetical protein
MKSAKVSLAFLLSFSLLALVAPFSAQADVSKQPQIVYSDNTGLNLAVVPGSINGFKAPKLQWFVGGKAVAGATKAAFKASAKQKNQSIQLKVTASDGSASSVAAKIGQVIVNVKPTASLVDASGGKAIATAGVFSPKTAKVTYQWFKGPVEIEGAKFATYSTAGIDQGFKVYVIATYSAKGFTDNKVVSSEVSAVFDDLEYFHVSNADPEQDQYNMGIEKIGTLGGRYQVFRDPYFPSGKVLVGHKGKSLLDAGYIYAPYVPLQLTPTMYNPFSMTPIKGILTRYAKKLVNNRYYGVIDVKGITTFSLDTLR